MNKLSAIGFSVLAILAADLQAEEPGLRETYEKMCRMKAAMAATIMESRQLGVPLDEVLDVLKKREEPVRSLVLTVILDAYSRPHFSTPAFRQDAINEFKNEVLVDCLAPLAQ